MKAGEWVRARVFATAAYGIHLVHEDAQILVHVGGWDRCSSPSVTEEEIRVRARSARP